MKKFVLLDVKTVDFSTFENYPGGEEFESEFKPFAKSRFTYKFYDAADLATAEKYLKEFGLSYSKHHQIELESDAEIKTHPAFYMIFSSDYNTVEITDGKLLLNPKKVKSGNFKNDIVTDMMFVSEKAKLFLEKETTENTFELVAGMQKPHYKSTIPELNFPLVYSDTAIVSENYKKPDRYEVKSDGRVFLEQDALKQLADNGLTVCNTFKINGKVYPNAYSRFIASGAFADSLRQEFNFKKENIIISPIRLEENK